MSPRKKNKNSTTLCIRHASTLIPITTITAFSLNYKIVTKEENAKILIRALADANAYEEGLACLFTGKKVSKIPGCREVCFKSGFSEIMFLVSCCQEFYYGEGSDGDNNYSRSLFVTKFWPKTFVLPNPKDIDSAYKLLSKNKTKNKKSNIITMIYKPSTGSQGKSILKYDRWAEVLLFTL